MRRYTFLLLAFFLTFSSHAEGLGFSTSMMGVSAAPGGLSSKEGDALRIGKEKSKASKSSKRIAYANLNTVKETSPRNINELGNISESTQRTQRLSTNGVPNLAAKKGKTALSNVTCKTYEGKIYGRGEAGYSDCIRTIKTDRQTDRVVP